MGKRLEVLDHGYLEIVEHYGSDERIIEAARQSTQKGFLGWGSDMPEKCANCGKLEPDPCGPNFVGYPDCDSTGRKDHNWRPQAGDEKLLRTLWENGHSTPFEFAGAVVEVQAPIFVFREWHRHRTQSYSEASARYAPLPDVNYVPSVDRLMADGGTNKQASKVAGAPVLSEFGAARFRDDLQTVYALAEKAYEAALQTGVPKELARLVMPVGRYSRMRASANLRNWLAFLTLREAPNAQWEIRQYAIALHCLLTDLFPRTIQLFEEKR